MKLLTPALVCFGVLLVPSVAVVPAELSPEAVRSAIDRGVANLEQCQRTDGNWGEFRGGQGFPGGITCLCTLALLNSGVDPQDPHIQNALQVIRRLGPPLGTPFTYVVSLQTMVLCRAEPKKDQLRIGKNVKWLVDRQINDGGPRSGAWSYPTGNGDGSNSQFALLALYEAERAAEAGLIQVDIPRATWDRAKAYWTKSQNSNGSFGYFRPLGGTGSMTCAGIASLVIADDMVRQPNARVVGDKIDCCYHRGDADADPIENAMRWLERNFTVESNPGSSAQFHLYYLYGLERAGRMTNRRFIGKHDWYREGTACLIRSQDPLNGYWQGEGYAEEDRETATALALLFLSKGRRPVLLAKLKHGPADNWNSRPSDVHNLTLYVESQWKQDLSWQIVDLDKASVEDLQRSPVLYLAGTRSPLPPDDEQAQALAHKLHEYLDGDGFLLAEADCCADGFDAGFRQLMRLVFPEEEYRLKPLDPSHPVWHAEQRVPADQVRPLWGIDFGCRTSVVYAPRDPAGDPRPSLSCLWELSRAGRDVKFSRAVQAQIDGARIIGINILAYATNRELKKTEEFLKTPEVHRDDTVSRGRLDIVNLRHTGGCDAAPRALATLMETASKNLKTPVNLHPVLLDITNKAIFDHPLVFMHGRTAFRLADRERDQLRTYLERGGLLFADAICSSTAFAESFRQEMALILPKNALAPIAATDPLWTPKYGGFDLSKVTRRDPQPQGDTGHMRVVARQVPPELEGAKLGGHYAVIFSPLDISCALERHDSLECRGYSREDAARIGLNVLRYAMQP